MRSSKLSLLLLFVCLTAAALVVNAQDPPPETPTPGGARPGAGGPPSTDPQPYDKVITKDAKTKKGVFAVHQVKDKFYYEIPKSEFGKEYLWVAQIAKTTVGVGYGGQALGNRVVRWELIDNKVHLRNRNYSVIADPKTPISEAVQASNNDSILMTFNVAAWGPNNDTAVIEVTRLFNTDVFEFSARQRLNATALDTARSFIERITPYPTNIEAESSMTYTRAATPAAVAAALRSSRV